MRPDKNPAIENLRLFLMALVVAHHAACSYGGPWLWYYHQPTRDPALSTLLLTFIAVNQSFFMGLFFFIAAYFTAASLDRKGVGVYLKERCLRLGVPLLAFFLVISPITKFMATRHLTGGTEPLWRYLVTLRGIGFGPLWFVEALLYFSIVYALARGLPDGVLRRCQAPLGPPGAWALVVFAAAAGILSAGVRLWFPVGWALAPCSFQLGHFPQYLLMFAMGVAAWRGQWLTAIAWPGAQRWFLCAQLLIFAGAPAMLLLGGGLSGNLRPFYGGWHWQALAYAVWEQMTGVALMTGLLGIFHTRLGRQPDWVKSLSESTYGVLLVHAPILVALGVVLHTSPMDPFYKFVCMVPLGVPLSFAAAALMRKLPAVKKVL
jgi:fucose 4-O-acetylase-like acetyltransferase